MASALALGHGYRMSMSGFDDTSPPIYPYLKAVPAHSAAVQLYARSGQLATAEILHSRGKTENRSCPRGCNRIGDMHHLFVHCEEYAEWRNQAGLELVLDTEKRLQGILKGEELQAVLKTGLLRLAESIFADDSSMWPLQKNVYYLGKHPSPAPYINETTVKNVIIRRRATSHIAMEWHSRSIRLAGLIFGDYQRCMAVLNGCRKRPA